MGKEGKNIYMFSKKEIILLNFNCDLFTMSECMLYDVGRLHTTRGEKNSNTFVEQCRVSLGCFTSGNKS